MKELLEVLSICLLASGLTSYLVTESIWSLSTGENYFGRDMRAALSFLKRLKSSQKDGD
ncbi:hypothetical protein M988_2021 [Hafnia paralvei ATCC 29927]|nr:hypothetical protein M988_2021 [Hafnia paralvei ATCC 29927]